MNKEEIQQILDQLASGELEKYETTKESFMPFREELLKREDFKHFRGEAHHNGAVVYTYLAEARS